MKSFRTRTLAIWVTAIWLAAPGARAQSGFTNLVSFTGNTGAYPGATPNVTLVMSGGTLYGTTLGGGSLAGGTVFKVNLDGTGFASLNSFPQSIYGQDHPQGGLAVAGSTLYGTTANSGTLFELNTNGTGLTNLSLLDSPRGNLVLAGNTLYDTDYGECSVFSFNLGSLTLSNIYLFSGTDENPTLKVNTNSDGSTPSGGLVLSVGTLYGTAESGGTGGNGTVFKVDTDSSNFTTLHTFSFGAFDPALQANTNNDGAHPYGTLVLSGNMLYGTTSSGGSNNNGTVFSLDTAGTTLTTLHTFSALTSSTAPIFEALTNADGADPYGGLILSGSTLYGTAYAGGAFGAGTLFAISTNGSGFTTLYNFSGNADGANPYGGLLLSGGTLYGTAEGGGLAGDGTVFAVSLSPALVNLNIHLTGSSVVLTWNNASFFLQSAPTVNGAYSTLTRGYSPFTNNITGTQQFFRLVAN